MIRIALAALAIAGPALAQAPDWTKARPVYVTMTDRGYAPRRIELRHGMPYVLHVTNRSDRSHNLSAKGFMANAEVDPRDRRRVRDGQITLPAHASTSVRIVAPDTPASRYGFRSTMLPDAGDDYTGAFYVR